MMEFKTGDKFELLKDVELEGVVEFITAATGGFKGSLHKGMVLVVEHEPEMDAVMVTVSPDDYMGFEGHYLASVTADKEYLGYHFQLPIADFDVLYSPYESSAEDDEDADYEMFL
jgi:hypothetical protein